MAPTHGDLAERRAGLVRHLTGKRGRFLAALTALVAPVAAGCAGGAIAGQPRSEPAATHTAPTTTSAPADPGPHNNWGAPPVRNPLDATRFLGDPCTVLTQEQLAVFGVEPTRPGDPNTTGPLAEHVGPQCIWFTHQEIDAVFDVGFITGGDKTGLGVLYANRATEEYFEETTVRGYPAVWHSGVDLRADGVCNISVGISDTMSFRSAYWMRAFGAKTADHVCAMAKRVAAAVVAGLQRNP